MKNSNYKVTIFWLPFFWQNKFHTFNEIKNMDYILHALGICHDGHSHPTLISLLSIEMQYAVSYLKTYFKY